MQITDIIPKISLNFIYLITRVTITIKSHQKFKKKVICFGIWTWPSKFASILFRIQQIHDCSKIGILYLALKHERKASLHA